MQLAVPRAYDAVTWLGRGPHESYADRKASAAVGLYSGSVDEQFHPTSGRRRPATRATSLDRTPTPRRHRPARGRAAARRRGGDRFLPDDFEYGPSKGQRHPTDMTPRDLVVLNVDLGQMGVGGDDSWGAKPHDEYMLFAAPYAYSFRLRPYSTPEEAPGTLARQRP